MTDSASGFEEVKREPESDPIEVLIERIKGNLAVAYEAAAIEMLAKLKASNLGRFIKVFADLKQIPNLAIGSLRQAIEKAERKLTADGGSQPKTAEDILLNVVRTYSGFRDGDTCYFDVNVADHRETLRVGDGRLTAIVRAHYFDVTRQAVPSDTIKMVLDTVAARVALQGEQRPVFCRIGTDESGGIYFDLRQPEGAYVRITAEGWEVCKRLALSSDAGVEEDAPVRFAYLRNALPLPTPEHGGSVDDLRPFLVHREGHEGDEIAFVLIVGWLIGCLSPGGPYPGLGLGGPPGSGKTTLLRLLRRLIDPSRALARSAPKDERDLMISAQRSYVLSYDNLSRIPAELSDAFCRLATGGGLATRQLYSDSEEMVFEACRPILLTAIADVVTRPDLADRVIALILPTREGTDRLPDDAVEQRFQAAWPRILGVLLTAASAGLRRLPAMKPIEDLPRMAGFATWVTACETSLGWAEGTFLKAYRENIRAAADVVADADPVAAAVIEWIKGLPASQPAWEGTTTEALALLNAVAGHAAQSRKGWPASPQRLANRFRALGPTLERLGIRVSNDRILHGRPVWIFRRTAP